MRVVERDDRSASSFLLRALIIKPWASQLTKIKEHTEPGSPRLTPTIISRKLSSIEERQVEGVYLYDITNKEEINADEPSRKPKRIYYIAGGSWQTTPNDHHWNFLSDLAARLEKPATVTLISCPLAPQSPAEITFPMLDKLWKALSANGQFEKEDICFAGDSSGGNIVLSWVMQQLGQDDNSAPASILLVSPSVDLSHQHPGLEEASKRDPMESLKMVKSTAKAWAQDLDETDPRLSPALPDISILAKHNIKIYGIIAGDDVLSVEAEEFVKRCEEEHIDGRFLVWRRQMHNFPIMSPYTIPESVKAAEWIALVCNQGFVYDDETKKSFDELEAKESKAFAKHVMPVRLFKNLKSDERGV